MAILKATLATVGLTLGLASVSQAETGREAIMERFIDGCRLLIQPDSFKDRATSVQLDNAMSCQAATETGMAVATGAGSFTYLGKRVCVPVYATPKDLAMHIVAMPISHPEVYSLQKPSDVVLIALVSKYRCDKLG